MKIALTQAAERAELAAQVAQVRSGVEPAADDPLQCLLRRELAAVAPELLAQPVASAASGRRARCGPSRSGTSSSTFSQICTEITLPSA